MSNNTTSIFSVSSIAGIRLGLLMVITFLKSAAEQHIDGCQYTFIVVNNEDGTLFCHMENYNYANIIIVDRPDFPKRIKIMNSGSFSCSPGGCL